MFDRDGDGKITQEELKAVLGGENVQSGLPPSELQKIGELMQEFDTNKDGVIDFEEFCAMMKSQSPP